MKCPRCVQRIHRGAEQCPHCGFSMYDMEEAYGAGEVRMRRLSDSAGALKAAERRKVAKWFAQFERSFPQLFFSVYYGSLNNMANIRQFGMWLLNHGAFEDVDITRPNEGGVLLVVDVNSKVATISFGYLLDAFLSEEDTFKILSAAHPYLLQGEHLKGLRTVIKKLTTVLKKRAKQARKNPEKFEKIAGVQHRGMGDILERIRSGRDHSEKAATREPQTSGGEEIHR